MKLLSKYSEAAIHGLFGLLLLMAIVMYKERLFADASYYFFHAINTGFFHVEHGRIVLGLSQIAPLLAYYLQLPLKAVILAASLGHELFYYGLFLFVFYKLKDQAGGIAILLIHVIGQLWLYYSPMLEICYGAGLAVLFYSILKSNKYKDDKWLILLIICQWFVMTSHPENFLLIAVAITYDFIQRGFQKRIHIITSIFLIIGFVIEILTFSEYEKGHSNITAEGSPASMLNLFNADYAGKVFNVFFEFFPELILFLIVSLVFSLIKKRYLVSLLIVGSSFGLIAVVNQVALATQFTRYYESMYNPLVLSLIHI